MLVFQRDRMFVVLGIWTIAGFLIVPTENGKERSWINEGETQARNEVPRL